MGNTIPQVQNEDHSIRLLATQRRLYGWAKDAQAAQIVLVILLPVILFVLGKYIPSLKIWAAFAGLTIAMLDVALFEPIKLSFQKHAALVQELFDCKVLKLEWTTLKGPKPDLEDIYGATSETSPDLKNWYPADIGEVSLHAARVICQRSNCWWDSKLRRFYRNVALGLSSAFIISITLIAIANNLSLADFIMFYMAPILPIILWGLREASKHSHAAERVSNLKSFGDQLWDQIMRSQISPESATDASRRFQDEIFEHRRQSPMIFNWFYRLLRTRFEGQMQYSSAEMIKECNAAGL